MMLRNPNLRPITAAGTLVVLAASWTACSASPTGSERKNLGQAPGNAPPTDGPAQPGPAPIDAMAPPGEDVVICRADDPNDDMDGDGFTPHDGDCDDCDPNKNPGAVEVVSADGAGLGLDEDCDGEIDEIDVAACDADLKLDDTDAMNAARALGLCQESVGDHDWGVLRAAWVLPDGTAPPDSKTAYHLGHGILPKFGANVATREGSRMLVLSSGTARQPDDPGFESPSGFDKSIDSSHPPGFPKEAPACPGVTTGTPHDAVALELEIRVPTNATGFSFDFNFFTYEWPDFVCSEYNDFFVALLDPKPEGQVDGNISFDSQGNPVGVNSAFLEVCGCPQNPPGACMAGGKPFMCPKGNLDLVGTGFGSDTGSFGGDHAATGWLRTQAPAEPGSIVKLRLTVYDSGDAQLDTTTLIDNFRWLAEPGINVVTEPPVK